MKKTYYTKKEKVFSFSQLARCISFAFIFGASSLIVLNAQTMPAAQSLPYSQNFSSLTGSSPTYPVGWQAWQVAASAPSSTGRTGVPTADKTISVGTGASTGSGAYDFTGKIGFMSVASSDVALCLALNTTGKSNINPFCSYPSIK